MPERILRDLTDSEAYNEASVYARDTFVRIMNKADDFGLFYADARRLRPLLYPLLLDKVREADLSRWIAECEKSGLVRRYTASGREYLQVRRWRQRLRNKRAKFPEPPWGFEPPADVGQVSVIRGADDSHPHPDAETDTETENPPDPPGGGGCSGFDAFWSAYPSGLRKVGRPKCRTKWERDQLEKHTPAVLTGLERWKKTKHWADGFMVQPHRFLNDRFWETDPGNNGAAVEENGFERRQPTQEDIDFAEGRA